MSFNVDFYFNKSENNRLDKDLESVNISTQQCVFKAGSSILTPTLQLQYSNDSSASRFFKCNYVKLSSPINRYYYVDDIIVVANKLVEIRCHVDVLMTYKDAIRANTAIIQRQENQWNLYLNDGTFKIYQNPVVLTREFPAGFTTQSFVLALAGG